MTIEAGNLNEPQTQTPPFFYGAYGGLGRETDKAGF
jgi:hypothetical protein